MGGSGTHGGMQQGTGPGQHMMGQGMAENMAMMSDMMNEMRQDHAGADDPGTPKADDGYDE